MHPEAVVCVKCGVPAGKGNQFCQNCGAPTHAEATFCTTCGMMLGGANNPKKKATRIEPRNLVTAIILTLVTCGFYGIYWFIKLTDEINELADMKGEPSGGVCFLLSLVTCGIYTYYWAYMMGKKQESMEGAGENRSYTPILYLVLSIMGFGIVTYALLQDAINKCVE